ncbi:MAG: enoyl-CoA hydratase/isomerase family protein [Gracilibacteraceae bacterium]|jgi:enoyl-CoA hydratase|nr:enoyl-CoA hydratase/isomerase family protein [Gracilibacteraceae bacterium]
MKERQTHLVELLKGHTAVITMNRPKILNCLDLDSMSELSEIFDELKENEDVRTIIITGAGDKAFCAGDDVKPMVNLNPKEAREWVNFGQQLMHKIEEFEKPIFAAVNGYAMGGGIEMALACDFRVASLKAKFGVPEVKIGMCPAFGGGQRLTRLVGTGMAKWLTLSGCTIDAQEAYRIGLAEFLAPQEELLEQTLRLADELNARSQVAVRMSKVIINYGRDMDIRTACRYEGFVAAECYASEDQREGMQAFVEKRPPSFTGKYK